MGTGITSVMAPETVAVDVETAFEKRTRKMRPTDAQVMQAVVREVSVEVATVAEANGKLGML